jgi:hypothetical protein
MTTLSASRLRFAGSMSAFFFSFLMAVFVAISICCGADHRLSVVQASAVAPAQSASDPRAQRTAPPIIAPAARAFHVATTGSDANPGDETRPFATLEAARDAIRQLKQAGPLPSGGVVVWIRGGEYRVEDTFQLTSEDSGTAEAPIVFAAKTGERPIFTGGVRLAGFQPVQDTTVQARWTESTRDKVQVLDLAAAGITNLMALELGGFGSGRGFRTHPQIELFFNDVPMTLARWPNKGFVQTGPVLGPETLRASWGGIRGTPEGRFRFDDERLGRWREESDVWLFGYWYWDWADSYERVETIDFEAREITLAQPWHRYGFRTGQRFLALNVLAEIDQPGEWYLDRDNLRLYLYPPADLTNARVELSLTHFPMARLEDVSHVRFEGLTWELGGADGLLVRGGEGVLIAGCTIRKLAGNGVEFRGGQRHGLLSCDIHTLGRGGAVVAGGDRKTLAAGGHFVENCLFHDLGRIDRTYTPAVWMDGVGNRIAFNRMRHLPSSAIRLNGNEHTVEFNEIHHVVLESDDQGAIDMWGNATYRGNVIRYNFWHHIGNWDAQQEELHIGAAAVRLDDAICGVLIHGNIFHRCASGSVGFGAVQIHGGKENQIVNNLFSESRAAVSFTAWNDARWRETIRDSLDHSAIDRTLYLERYPELRRLAEDANRNTVASNLVHRCDQLFLRDPGVIESMENRVVDDLPGVRVDRNDRLTLPATSAERARHGLPDIPFAEIGLYSDPYRRAFSDP